MANEAPQNSLPEPLSQTPPEQPSKKIKIGFSHWHRFLNWYKTDKKKSIPLTLLFLIVLIALIPWTRYPAASLVLKKDYNVRVLDSKAHSPVSGATVSAGSVRAQTDGSGKATLKGVKVGTRSLTISKKYYKDQKLSTVVPILSQKNTPDVNLTATGRQAKIKVTNTVSHAVLSDVEIKVAGISAKTDKNGVALVVLPAGTASHKATISLNGFNNKDVTVQVSDQTVKENDFTITPAGKIYFLSKLSGKIDVVKTNLDGSERQTVVAGSGKEEDTGTVLLASRDWKYLALLARHDSNQPKLYLIETANDKLTTIDEGDAYFNLVGWSDDNFIYQVTRNTVADWQPKKFVLKSFDANSKQLLLLDQSSAEGNSNSYTQEQFGTAYADGSTIIYYKLWYRFNQVFGEPDLLSGKNSGLYSIKNDGSNKKTLKSLAAMDTNYIYTQFDKPGQIFITVTQSDKSAQYLQYANGNLQTISADQIPDNSESYTYLLSPSGKSTFWSEERDGKNTLFIGGSDGNNGKQIAALSDYQTYGWYTDDYLLVSKNGSELYAMPVGGLKADQEPVKISDYHKPALSYYGYGGGYGGI